MYSSAIIGAIIESSEVSGVPVDVICYLSRGLEPTAIARLCGNVSTLPVYMKSNDMPYRFCILRAPSIDILKDPDSH